MVIDDAQWVDEPSREVLLFAARRLRDEPVRLLLASRDDEAGSLAGVGVPELVVGPLSPEDSVRLLMGTGDVSPAVAAVIQAATGGNPLALLTVPATLTADQRVGRAALEDPLPVGSALAVFGRLAQALPDAAQRALLVACADGSGRLSPLLTAFDHLRLARDALDAAERAHLVRTIGDRITVRHPLTRSAVYHGADVAERRTAHRALAVAYEGRDPDRYAWHLGRAAHGEDERAAATLEEAASRAARRQGYAAAVDAYALAAGLSPRADDRARRLVSAARAAELAGLPERMLALTREAAAVTEEYACSPTLRCWWGGPSGTGTQPAPWLLSIERRGRWPMPPGAGVCAARPGRCRCDTRGRRAGRRVRGTGGVGRAPGRAGYCVARDVACQVAALRRAAAGPEQCGRAPRRRRPRGGAGRVVGCCRPPGARPIPAGGCREGHRAGPRPRRPRPAPGGSGRSGRQ